MSRCDEPGIHKPCRIQAAPLKTVADWLEDDRRFWDERFERLDAYLSQL